MALDFRGEHSVGVAVEAKAADLGFDCQHS
jgi:DNA-binding HxlR family transcriptional regulator